MKILLVLISALSISSTVLAKPNERVRLNCNAPEDILTGDGVYGGPLFYVNRNNGNLILEAAFGLDTPPTSKTYTFKVDNDEHGVNYRRFTIPDGIYKGWRALDMTESETVVILTPDSKIMVCREFRN